MQVYVSNFANDVSYPYEEGDHPMSGHYVAYGPSINPQTWEFEGAGFVVYNSMVRFYGKSVLEDVFIDKLKLECHSGGSSSPTDAVPGEFFLDDAYLNIFTNNSEWKRIPLESF